MTIPGLHSTHPVTINDGGREFRVGREEDGVRFCWEIMRGRLVPVKEDDLIDWLSVAFKELTGSVIRFDRMPPAQGPAVVRTFLTDSRARGVPCAKNQMRPGGFLDSLALLCWGEEVRAEMESSAAHLRKDVREMQKRGWHPARIMAARAWRTATAIVPIVWDGVKRTILAVLKLAGEARRFLGPGV